MKKVFAICLMIALVASISITAFAAPHGFVESPSGGRRPPVLDQSDRLDDDCKADVTIISYGDKNDLSEEDRKELEDAYDDITNAGDLTELNKELDDAADKKGIDEDKLAVSDLFYVDCDGCEDHNDDHKFDLTVDTDTIDNFVGLIYRDDDGKWHWVPDAKVDADGLHFTGMGYYPYAIIVDTTEAKTSDTATVLICAVVMAVSAVALAVVLVKGKKQHA